MEQEINSTAVAEFLSYESYGNRSSAICAIAKCYAYINNQKNEVRNLAHRPKNEDQGRWTLVASLSYLEGVALSVLIQNVIRTYDDLREGEQLDLIKEFESSVEINNIRSK